MSMEKMNGGITSGANLRHEKSRACWALYHLLRAAPPSTPLSGVSCVHAAAVPAITVLRSRPDPSKTLLSGFTNGKELLDLYAFPIKPVVYYR